MNLDNLKELPEYPEYLLSKSGDVYSTKSNRLLKIRVGSTGYPFFSVHVMGKQKHISLHRALCRVYKNLPSLESELEVDHKDTDKLNFSLANLVVMTKEEHREKTTTDRGETSSEESFCKDCGNKTTNDALRCRPCYKKSVTKDISVDDIVYWVTNYSWVRAGKELGMSDNGLRKKYKALTGKDPKQIKWR